MSGEVGEKRSTTIRGRRVVEPAEFGFVGDEDRDRVPSPSSSDPDEEDALRTGEEPDPEEVWQIGSTNESDDEGGVVPHTPRPTRHRSASARSREGEEERMIVDEDEEGRASTSSDATLTRPESSPPYADDEFGTWEQGKLRR